MCLLLVCSLYLSLLLTHSLSVSLYILFIMQKGRIGAANVLSDLYATGVADCDFMLMLLAASRDMDSESRQVCTREMVRGFRECCEEADAPITGGQTVLNPWPIIGGVATTVVTSQSDFCPLNQAVPGHVVLLTKPIGTQVAVNVHQWRSKYDKQLTDDDKSNNITCGDAKLWKKSVEKASMTVEKAETMMHQAVCSMARLNRTAAQILNKKKADNNKKKVYDCSACTDVTGFGILGHAQNLAENQIANVAIMLDKLPCIANTMQVNDDVLNFRLRAGYSAETSGGLLICLPSMEIAEQYCQELLEQEGYPSWIVGRVVESTTRKCEIVDNVEIIEV